MLEIKDLSVQFPSLDGPLHACDKVSLCIKPGQSVGLVGESGSGKSVTAMSAMRLLPQSASISGHALWKGRDLFSLSEQEMQGVRGGEIASIFQNPLAALNPVYTIREHFLETLALHKGMTASEAESEAISLLKQVNIPSPETRIWDYPHRFSLGMCQRIMIALTLAMRPELLIADEPTASLDVTVQAQIMRLLDSLKDRHGMSILLISHDLGIIAQHCEIIYVMYLGSIVEIGSPEDIFSAPKHPYTQALIHSIPSIDPTHKHTAPLLSGDIPSASALPSGCRFHPRCPEAMAKCRQESPILGSGPHPSACFLT